MTYKSMAKLIVLRDIPGKSLKEPEKCVIFRLIRLYGNKYYLIKIKSMKDEHITISIQEYKQSLKFQRLVFFTSTIFTGSNLDRDWGPPKPNNWKDVSKKTLSLKYVKYAHLNYFEFANNITFLKRLRNWKCFKILFKCSILHITSISFK